MKRGKITTIYWLLVLIIQAVGCVDVWNDHYENIDGASTGSADGIIDRLSELKECSEFYTAVMETGVDKLIHDNFIYTVLAPLNGHFNMDSIPEEFKKKFILMHFTYGKYITNQLDGARLEMFSKKFLNFKKHNNSVIIDNYANIIKSDIKEFNGVIHLIDTILVYKRNVYEYMYEEFPFLGDHFDSKVVNVFDPFNSEPTGKFNHDGLTIYDTVWNSVNTFLRDIADLTNEQEQYTLIIPTKQVVDNALESNVSKYFGGVKNVPPIIYKDILDGIIGNAVFPNAYTFDNLPDELVSLAYMPQSINKSAIFEKDAELSNGVLHKTNQIKIDNSSFLRTIKVKFRNYLTQDREDGSLDFYIENFSGNPGDNRRWNVSNHSSAALAPNILMVNQNGILVWGRYFTEDNWIEFEVPNVLQATYKIWFNPKGGYFRPKYLVQFRNEDGTWEEEQFEVLSHKYRPGKIMGEVTFETFGKKTIRFTSIPGGSKRKYNTSLYELRLIPVTD